MSLIKSRYKDLLKAGDLSKDEAQANAIGELVKLEKRVLKAQSFVSRLLTKSKAPLGLYLWGPPGRGKSMMMDLFFNAIDIDLKRRVHFHAFMDEVHHLIAQWRERSPKARQALFGLSKGDDPIVPTAKYLAKKARLLCFDEFQVSDIADAMILGRLFEALWDQGVSIVATSNRAPEELYKNGLNRDLFLPFIEMIRKRMKIHELKGPRDFRLDRLRAARVYFCPTTDPSEVASFEALWTEMTRLNTELETVLSVNERKLKLTRAAGPLLRVQFDDLCAQTLGAADYLAIAERFTTIFLEQVPRLTPEKRNEAKRFVTLIDALYEASTKLVVLAAAEPKDLYPSGDGAFEFERTVSRLEEMRSEDYINR